MSFSSVDCSDSSPARGRAGASSSHTRKTNHVRGPDRIAHLPIGVELPVERDAGDPGAVSGPRQGSRARPARACTVHGAPRDALRTLRPPRGPPPAPPPAAPVSLHRTGTSLPQPSSAGRHSRGRDATRVGPYPRDHTRVISHTRSPFSLSRRTRSDRLPRDEFPTFVRAP